jgi:hypothetical protein
LNARVPLTTLESLMMVNSMLDPLRQRSTIGSA